MSNEIFESAVRATHDLAGVYGYDGETGYFYLYDLHAVPSQKSLASIHILSGLSDFEAKDVEIRWGTGFKRVGLFIRDQLWAVFDDAGEKFGGDYVPGRHPQIPPQVVATFSRDVS